MKRYFGWVMAALAVAALLPLAPIDIAAQAGPAKGGGKGGGKAGDKGKDTLTPSGPPVSSLSWIPLQFTSYQTRLPMSVVQTPSVPVS